MRHITEEYGQPCNLLELTEEEYRVLDAFLMNLGIRSRRTSSDFGKGTTVIQAENPYRERLLLYFNRSAAEALESAEQDMSEKQIAWYKT